MSQAILTDDAFVTFEANVTIGVSVPESVLTDAHFDSSLDTEAETVFERNTNGRGTSCPCPAAAAADVSNSPTPEPTVSTANSVRTPCSSPMASPVAAQAAALAHVSDSSAPASPAASAANVSISSSSESAAKAASDAQAAPVLPAHSTPTDTSPTCESKACDPAPSTGSASGSVTGSASGPGSAAIASHGPGRSTVPIKQRFKHLRTLKETIYGKVVLAECATTKNKVAIKMSRRSCVASSQFQEDVVKEVKILRALGADGGHPHVLSLIDDVEDAEWYWTVLEFCPQGELFDIVASRNRFSEAEARPLFKQLAQGVCFIHRAGYCHLDLSLENLLLTQAGQLKICDFGLARECAHGQLFDAVHVNKPGKKGYMAPEIFASADFDGTEADIWALGVILFIMLTGVPPFTVPAASDARFKLIYQGNVLTLLNHWGFKDLSKASVDLLSALLCPPVSRLTIDKVLEHSWLDLVL